MVARRLALSCTLCALGVATPAHAAGLLTIKGAGFGHGVGMSQYGAYGYAQHGAGYKQILAHYYTGTALGTVTSDSEVTVLLRTSATAAFTGASNIGGRRLDVAKTYSVKVNGSGVTLLSPKGHKLVVFTGPVRIANGGQPVKLLGPGPNGITDGLFRGALEFRPQGSQLLVINALGLEDYVRGVVGGESPSSWPQEALRAQAVAARTYAIATSKNGNGFQQYADTRSQVYEGVAAETVSTDTAVAGTAGQVVTYLGQPIVAYFFSTSGGHTENVENSFIGATPQPYLKGVEDPYDGASPKHRWTIRMSTATAQAKLGSLVKGTFKAITVTKRGVSPRVVTATVVGSRGTTAVTGPTLRAKLGLYDTWASFAVTSTKVGITPRSTVVPAGEGVALKNARLVDPLTTHYRHAVQGYVSSARAGQWVEVEQRVGRRWKRSFWLLAGHGGSYRGTVPRRGLYRVVFHGVAGPTVRAR